MQPSSEKIDAESQKFLQDVKKGKPRKFVMIKEGVQIDRLYVFKKGPFDRYVRMAKQDGVRGQAFWGVVRGDGNDIHFELSRADGFNEPPGKDIRLKEFLKEETSFKFDPDYVIVDALAPLNESEDEDKTDDAPRHQSQEAGAADDSGEKFITLLKKILPHVKRALATPTSVSDELKSRVAEAQGLGRQRDFEQGLATLRIVGQLTKAALAEAESTQTASDPGGRTIQRSSQLRTRAEEAEASGTSFAKDIERRFQQVDGFIQKKQFDRADKLLDQLERLVQRAQAETNRRRQWLRRIAEVEPRYQEQLRESTDGRSLRAIYDYAQMQAQRKQFVKALVALDRLEPLFA